MQNLYDYYVVKNTPQMDEEAVSVVAGYPRYIVDVILGYYLGDPIKYDSEEDKGEAIDPGSFEATVKNGRVIRHQFQEPLVDISPVIDAYDNQSISECDSKVGAHLGIYGEAYELEYATEEAMPKTTVCDPRNSIMVRDTTVDHNKLFFMTYEKRERVAGGSYYLAYVYTDSTLKYYVSAGTTPQSFSLVPGSEQAHFFGEVPAVEYQNNFERIGDFEPALSLIDAYNELLSDRCTDKKKFIDSILAIYGFEIDDDSKDDLQKYRMVDNLPTDGRIEYIQKVFDESSVHVLADDLILLFYFKYGHNAVVI